VRDERRLERDRVRDGFAHLVREPDHAAEGYGILWMILPVGPRTNQIPA
jgi:hypothetical protein